MEEKHRSSSHVQCHAETIVFHKIREMLGIELRRNCKVLLDNKGLTYMLPDFYSDENCVVGEIFAHIGKPKKAQDNKIANDILKMLLLEKVKGREHRKIIAVCDWNEKTKLEGKSVLAESIRQFGIEIIYVEIDAVTRGQILQAQKLQKMTNAE